jgi:hypothetical protein
MMIRGNDGVKNSARCAEKKEANCILFINGAAPDYPDKVAMICVLFSDSCFSMADQWSGI